MLHKQVVLTASIPQEKGIMMCICTAMVYDSRNVLITKSGQYERGMEASILRRRLVYTNLKAVVDSQGQYKYSRNALLCIDILTASTSTPHRKEATVLRVRQVRVSSLSSVLMPFSLVDPDYGPGAQGTESFAIEQRRFRL